MEPSPEVSATVAGVAARQSFARFKEALLHITRFMTDPLLESPLDTAIQRIEENPAFTQHRMLTRLLAAIPGQQGEFRTEEASVFDRNTLALIRSLIHAYDSGTSSAADWQHAIERTRSAQVAFTG